MTKTPFRAALIVALFAFTATSIVGAQNNANNGQRITPNFKDAEIGQVIEAVAAATGKTIIRSEEHTSELQSCGLISYAVFCFKKQAQSRSQRSCGSTALTRRAPCSARAS